MQFKTDSLTPSILRIVRDKGTEYPFTGEYNDLEEEGTYLCRHCGLALFRANSKFHSGCGWPSFDAEIEGHLEQIPDPDGQRTEIICKRCHAHLGHVFLGEKITPLNTRHCVNSLSLDFVADQHVQDSEEAILAGGCFWGVEYFFKKLPGVLKVVSGYTGGFKNDPTYEEVCSKETGHVEAVRVLYDPEKLSYEEIVKYFFEIHDPTQSDGQGPDIGEQYLSVIFYYDSNQNQIAETLIKTLKDKGLDIKTHLKPVAPFWQAEDYHQHYYQKTGKIPYCHFYTKRF